MRSEHQRLFASDPRLGIRVAGLTREATCRFYPKRIGERQLMGAAEYEVMCQLSVSDRA